jgi:type II secretory pathway pseudopilin PulG
MIQAESTGVVRLGGSGRRCGLTLIECMFATLVLSVTAVGLAAAIGAGRHQVRHATGEQHAARLADQLLEEIISRPYDGTGPTRATWCLDDYGALNETPGALTDGDGEPLGEADQVFGRACSVVPGSVSLTGLTTNPMPGKAVSVTVTGPSGDEWTFRRFIAEPGRP